MSTLIFCSRSWRAARLLGFLLAWLAAVGFLTPAVRAQSGYTRQEVDKKLLRELKLPVARMLAEGFKSGDEAKFDTYYAKCVFPEWTDPASYAKVPGPLQRMLGDLRRAKKGPVYDRLNQMVLDRMTEFAKGNYHPAARYNAMFMIGKLNAEEPANITMPPKPLPAALPVLLAAAADKDLPDAVHYAALLGAIRHSRYGTLDEPTRQKVVGLMLSLVAMRDPPAGRSNEGHAWFRRLAIDTLSETDLAGQQAPVAKAIAEVLSEADAPIPVRCDAARALGRLKLAPEMGLNPTLAGKSLETLLVDIAKEEIRADSEDKKYKIDPRKLCARLIPIRMALSGHEDEVARARSSAPFKAMLGLTAKTDAEKPLMALWQRVEYLLGKDMLDHADLVPKEPKAAPGEAGLPGMAPGHALGEIGGPGLPGPGIPGAPGTELDQPDPAKVLSDKIIAELKKIVEAYEKPGAGA